jgi:alpha-glucosidase
LRGKRAEFDDDKFEWLTAPSGALAFRGRGGLVCALNAGKRPVALPAGELILASAPLVDGQLPPDSAAWLV